MSDFLVRLQHLIYRNRSISFTPPGTRFVLLTLAVGIAAINTGNNLLYLIVGMMLSLIIVSGVLSEQSLKNIKFLWKFPSRIFARKPAEVELYIQNEKKVLPSLSFRISKTPHGKWSKYIFKLLAKESITETLQTVFENRGLQTLDPLVLHTTFPFGFFHKKLVRPQNHSVLVFPPVFPIELSTDNKQGPSQFISGEGRRKGRGTSLHSLRDYTPYDDARAIHWKASARETRVLLKEFEQDDEHHLYVFLSNHLPSGSSGRESPGFPGEETGKAGLDPDFERGVKIAASLAVAYQKNGFSVVLKTLSSRQPGLSGLKDLDGLLRELALVRSVDPDTAGQNQARWLNSPESRNKGGHRILIIPRADPLWDGQSSFFTEVLRADELSWRAWEARWEKAV